MPSTSDTTITFTVGRYSSDQTDWEAATNSPSATISVTLFRAIFDAVGDETIDSTGDIDSGVLLGLIDLGPHGTQQATARLRFVCQWARRQSLRVRFGYEEPMQ